MLNRQMNITADTMNSSQSRNYNPNQIRKQEKHQLMSGKDILDNGLPLSQSEVSTNQFLDDYFNDLSFQHNNNTNIQYSQEVSIISNQTEKYENMVRPAVELIVQKIHSIICYHFLKRLKKYNNKTQAITVLIRMNLMLSIKIKKILDKALFEIKQFAKIGKTQVKNTEFKLQTQSYPKDHFIRLFETFSILEIKVINRFLIMQAFKLIKKKHDRFQIVKKFVLLLQKIHLDKYSAAVFFQKINQIQITKEKLQILLFTCKPLFQRVKKQAFTRILKVEKQNTSFFQQLKQEQGISTKKDAQKIFILNKSFQSENILSANYTDLLENRQIKKEKEYYGYYNSSRNFQIVRTVEQRQLICKSEPDQQNQQNRLQFSVFKRKKNSIEQTKNLRSAHKSCSKKDYISNIDTHSVKGLSSKKSTRKTFLFQNTHLKTAQIQSQENYKSGCINESSISINSRKNKLICAPAAKLNYHNFMKSIQIQYKFQQSPLTISTDLKFEQKPVKIHQLQQNTLKQNTQDIGEKFSMKLIDIESINNKINTFISSHQKVITGFNSFKRQSVFQVNKPTFNQIQLPRYISLQKIQGNTLTDPPYIRQLYKPRPLSSKRQSFKQYLQRRKNEGIEPNRTPEKMIKMTVTQREVNVNEKQQVQDAYYPGFSRNQLKRQKIGQIIQRQRASSKQRRSKIPLLLNVNNNALCKNSCQFNPKYQKKKIESPAKHIYHGQYIPLNHYRAKLIN